MTILDLLGGLAVKVMAVVAVLAGTVGFLDTRHAKASDYAQLVSVRYVERVERFEDKIEETEDAINRLKIMTTPSDSEKLHLNQLSDRKAKYLRKLTAMKSIPR